jgi:peptidoglycan pentaglycine glycine transferase (the first glycine)
MTAMDEPLADAERWRAWDAFVEAHSDSGFMQSSWWARFREPIGFENFAVILKDGADIVGGALVSRWRFAPGRCFYYIQDGPLLPTDDGAFADQVFAALLDRLEQHRRADDERVSHLRIEPRWSSRPGLADGFEPPPFEDVYREPRRTLWLDLRGDDEQLLAQMKSKGRYNVRVAQRHGVVIEADNSAQGLADFLRIYRRTMVRHGLGAKPPSYFVRLLAAATPAATLLFARCRGRRIACALIVRFGRRATYFYGGSLLLHRQVMAPYLLHFDAARRARAAGCDWYDLWGVAPRGDTAHPWHAISEFKRKLGGVELDHGPTLDLVWDAAAYRRFEAVARRDSRGPRQRAAVVPAAAQPTSQLGACRP